MVVGEAGDMFALLEGGVEGARAAFDAFLQLYGAVREPWVPRALLLYHARTGSARAVELLARAPDLHARHLLDALHDGLRADRLARRQALAALAPLVARRPAWMHRLAAHPLLREVVRAARCEREPLPLLHALLTLAAVLPSAPALAGPHCAELADALLRPAALEPPPPPSARAHLQLAQLALFHALYATHPCTLVDALRAELASGARAAAERELAPLLRSVRLHPALVTGSRAQEADAARWARSEPHDVLAECRRLELHTRSPALDESPIPAPGTPEPAAPLAAPLAAPPATPPVSSLAAPLAVPLAAPLAAPPGSTEYHSRAANALRPGGEGWFLLSERCGAESAPATPLPAEPEPEPEAAVEATPENTPARLPTPAFRFPADSATVRAIGRRESPPAVEALSARLARVARERRAADSPVAFGRAPPPAIERPEPRPPRLRHHDTKEDQEVYELTARGRSAERGWPAADEPAPRVRDPRAGGPAPRPAPRAPGPGPRPPRRAASCGARLPPRRTASVACQTLDTWPEPYEFIIADFYRNLHPDCDKHINGSETSSCFPCEQLDSYLSSLYMGPGAEAGEPSEPSELSEQLALAHAALMYERWRRDSHAERNRRLLGRVRQVRALELQNAALKERVRALVRERESARARRPRSPPANDPEPAPAPAPAPAHDRERELERQLAAERAARARAEAALHESETARARELAELQRARAAEALGARHGEALARAALAAERRALAARRLRRELLVLAERDQRREAARRAACQPLADPANEKALRAALAKAEAEIESLGLRAEQAVARAAELEAGAGAREASVAELKRGARLAASQHGARLRALQDKYRNLRALVRGLELRRLELLAAAERARPGPVAAPDL